MGSVVSTHCTSVCCRSPLQWIWCFLCLLLTSAPALDLCVRYSVCRPQSRPLPFVKSVVPTEKVKMFLRPTPPLTLLSTEEDSGEKKTTCVLIKPASSMDMEPQCISASKWDGCLNAYLVSSQVTGTVWWDNSYQILLQAIIQWLRSQQKRRPACPASQWTAGSISNALCLHKKDTGKKNPHAFCIKTGGVVIAGVETSNIYVCYSAPRLISQEDPPSSILRVEEQRQQQQFHWQQQHRAAAATAVGWVGIFREEGMMNQTNEPTWLSSEQGEPREDPQDRIPGHLKHARPTTSSTDVEARGLKKSREFFYLLADLLRSSTEIGWT